MIMQISYKNYTMFFRFNQVIAEKKYTHLRKS